jgi:succinoglycan biosynthesis transport protein ExoP
MARTSKTPDAPDLRDYLAPVWRFKWIILALAIAVTAATYAYYDQKPKAYKSSTDLYLGASGVDEVVTGSEQTGSERELANQARVLRSRPVAARVAQKLGFSGDPGALLGALQVYVDPEADFLSLVTVWPDPHGAARLANAFARAFLDLRLATRRTNVDQALEAARGAVAELERTPRGRRSEERRELAAKISQLEILRSLPSGEAEQLDPARPAASPASPRPLRNAIFAFVLSLAFGVLAAYGLDRIDRRIREIDEVTPIYDAPLLGTVPRASRRLLTKGLPAIPAPLVESFRTLRTSLEIAGAETGTLLITSGSTGEGKSTIVRNLAMAYRDAGKYVAIVEADLRRPSAAEWLSAPAGPGLTDVLLGEVVLDEALHDVPRDAIARSRSPLTVIEQNGSGPPGTSNGTYSDGVNSFEVVPGLGPGELFLLPAGSPASDPPTLLGAPTFDLLLRELAERFDIVLIDSPPLLSVSDALLLLAKVDGTILVSRVGMTTEDSAERVAALVGRVHGAKLLGVVANDVPVAPRAPYGYAEYAPTA